MKRKFLCLLLALTMVLGLAATASAEEEIFTSGDWTYRLYGNEAVLCSYNGTAAEVTVPAEIDGRPVAELGWGLGSCFSGVADTLTSVTIEDGIPLINNAAFKDCTALTEVSIPASVTYIGSFTFQNCTALKEIALKEGLTHIGMFTFLNTGLTSVLIPSTVTDIGEYAFGCTGTMSDYDFIEGFTIYGYTGTAGHAYAADHDTFINFVDLGGNYDSSGRCGDSAFWEYTAATGTLHIYGHGGRMYEYDEVDQVPWFVHMPFIRSAVIEDVLDICYNAFHGCAELTTVTMSDTVEDIGTAAFKNTPKLTNIQLSANLKHISTAAFSNSGLTAIELPEGLTSIGTEAFCNTPLTAIVIPDSVTSIAQGAFYRCAELASVKLPAELEEIVSLTFEGCTSLKSIELPENLLVIGRQAFSRSGLTSIEIPDTVVAIGENAFLQNLNLEYVKLPASLEETGWRCFSECPKLSTIVMPESFAPNFTQCCFLDCDALTNIDFHTAPSIGFAMYQDCDGLTSLTIPACVTTIGDNAFAYCDQLSYVTVPEGVTGIGAAAFSNCPKLSAIAFRGDAPAFHLYAFQETTVTCYYPADNETWTEEVMQSYGGDVTWIPYEVLPFTDVPAGSFYYESVDWAVENGITTGATETTFNPGGQCQRGQIVTFLWRAAGYPVVEAENPFTDVKQTDFYYDAVLWAVEQGITTGTSETTFSPFKTCTRAEVVTFLWRAAGKPASAAANPFTDVTETDFFHTAVLWAVENGITNGLTPDSFGPYAICNRAQVVTFLYRAKDVPKADPPAAYTFELRSNDPAEEIGYVYCEGSAFAAGESVIFYAEPWYGYLVEFTAEPADETLELYYLGANTYELIMPAHDVVLTANFVPAPGDAHFLTTTCTGGFAFADCDYDEELNDIAKPGEHVLFYIIPDEGFTFSPEGFTASANGQSLKDFWYLGEVVEEDPELGTIDGIFLVELLMPDADVSVSITCTAETETAAAADVRIPVTLQ